MLPSFMPPQLPRSVLGLLAFSLLVLAGCDQTPSSGEASAPTLPGVTAKVETQPVQSEGDAADDPEIWVHPSQPEKSLVLGTDKKAGLYVYRLDGSVLQFQPAGRLNNVDLRQGVQLAAGTTADVAGATNRSSNSVDLFTVRETGVTPFASFATKVDPYGFCMGVINERLLAIIAYKIGLLEVYEVGSHGGGTLIGQHTFASQLEGCVHDDTNKVLYVGEELKGIWQMSTEGLVLGEPSLVDEVDGASGLAADIEGLTIYETGETSGYLLASSQGNNSYAVYSRQAPHSFLGRFEIKGTELIDGTEDTDGIAAAANLKTADFPEGLFVVQDGFNAPDQDGQNFKYVDWRDIKAALSLN